MLKSDEKKIHSSRPLGLLVMLQRGRNRDGDSRAGSSSSLPLGGHASLSSAPSRSYPGAWRLYLLIVLLVVGILWGSRMAFQSKPVPPSPPPTLIFKDSKARSPPQIPASPRDTGASNEEEKLGAGQPLEPEHFPDDGRPDTEAPGSPVGGDGGLVEWAPVGPDPLGAFPRSDSQSPIFLAWPFSSHDFGLHAHRSLESLLHVYPEALFTALTVAPGWATKYRFADVLPLTMFQKYSKRGYDVQVQIVQRCDLFPSPLPGSVWCKRNAEKLYQSGMTYPDFDSRTDELPSVDTLIAIVFASLLPHGGSFFDLTAFLVAPLPSGASGYATNRACHLPTTRGRRHTPLVLHFEGGGHPVVRCMLGAFDNEFSDMNLCLNNSSEEENKATCILDSLDACLSKEGKENMLRYAVDWLGCDEGAATTIKNEAPALNANAVAFWVGPTVSNGLWQHAPEGSLLAEMSGNLRLTKWKTQQISKECEMPCAHLYVHNDGEIIPQWQEEKDLSKSAASCAPSLFVVGAQKAASTFLFHAIAQHPQFISPLEGAHGFKETHIWDDGRNIIGPFEMPRLSRRAGGFPYIEPHENFVTGDGTVTYLSESMRTPWMIKRDNPYGKALFALRDPVDRAWSDYRFLSWLGSAYSGPDDGFARVVNTSLDVAEGCFAPFLEWLASHPSNQDVDVYGVAMGGFIDFYYSRECFRSAPDPGGLVRKSLYVFQVLHWMRVMGKDNVLVVHTGDFHHNLEGALSEVFSFMGMCPFDVGDVRDDNVTPKNAIAKGKEITKQSFERLQAFCEPFNRLLYDVIGRDLRWETNSFKADS